MAYKLEYGGSYLISETEYQEFLEYKKWLDTPCCELVEPLCNNCIVHSTQYKSVLKDDLVNCLNSQESSGCDCTNSREYQCPEENKHCSCTHIPYEDDWDETSLIDDILDTQETHDDILDDLNGEVRTLWEELDKLTDIVKKISDRTNDTSFAHDELWSMVKNVEGNMVMLAQRLDAQKLINKIIEERLPKKKG